MANKPRYEHDCTCTFVGFYKNYDLYCCNKVHLVVRYGDDGPDYSSCSINLVERNTFPEETKKALLKAKANHLTLTNINKNMATEITKEYSMDYHLNTIKETLDYINNDRRIRNRSGEGTEQLDSMIHDLTKVVRLIKGLNPKGMTDYERSLLPDEDDRKINL